MPWKVPLLLLHLPALNPTQLQREKSDPQKYIFYSTDKSTWGKVTLIFFFFFFRRKSTWLPLPPMFSSATASFLELPLFPEGFVGFPLHTSSTIRNQLNSVQFQDLDAFTSSKRIIKEYQRWCLIRRACNTGFFSLSIIRPCRDLIILKPQSSLNKTHWKEGITKYFFFFHRSCWAYFPHH